MSHSKQTARRCNRQVAIAVKPAVGQKFWCLSFRRQLQPFQMMKLFVSEGVIGLGDVATSPSPMTPSLTKSFIIWKGCNWRRKDRHQNFWPTAGLTAMATCRLHLLAVCLEWDIPSLLPG